MFCDLQVSLKKPFVGGYKFAEFVLYNLEIDLLDSQSRQVLRCINLHKITENRNLMCILLDTFTTKDFTEFLITF